MPSVITVGPPFFDQWMLPIGLMLLALTGIGPLLAWRKSTLANMRQQAEVYTGTGNAYANAACPAEGAAAGDNTVFDDANGGVAKLFRGITLSSTRCQSEAGVPRNGARWAVSAALATAGEYWCVDSSGTSRKTAAHVSSVVCP